jgi:integrase
MRLKIEDVDLEQSLIHVRQTKFFKRALFLSATVDRGMRAFIARPGHSHSAGAENRLFSNHDGTLLCGETLGVAFRRLCKIADIRRDGGACNQPRMHDLRHSAAVHRVTAWYRGDADLNDLLPKLATYLGHTGLAGTQRYLTMTQELLAEASSRFEAFSGGQRHGCPDLGGALDPPVPDGVRHVGAESVRKHLRELSRYARLAASLRGEAKGLAADALSVTDLSAELVRSFLVYLERERQCSTATRNQRLASIHALARFIGEHSPQHVEWCAQIRMVPIKKSMTACLTYLEKSEVDSLLAAPDQSTSQVDETTHCCCFSTTPALVSAKQRPFGSAT